MALQCSKGRVAHGDSKLDWSCVTHVTDIWVTFAVGHNRKSTPAPWTFFLLLCWTFYTHKWPRSPELPKPVHCWLSFWPLNQLQQMHIESSKWGYKLQFQASGLKLYAVGFRSEALGPRLPALGMWPLVGFYITNYSCILFITPYSTISPLEGKFYATINFPSSEL